MGKKLLKICCSEWKNASRDRRELSVCRELGMDVLVMAKGKTNELEMEVVDGFEVVRLSTRPLGKRAPLFLNRIASLFTWVHYARSLDVDIISGHDLDGLLIGWVSILLKRKSRKPKLVYDSHEFEIGRKVRRSSFAIWGITHLERLLIKGCAFSIVVNDCIADELQRIHKLSQCPVVIRSTPINWEINQDVCAEKRKEFLAKMDEENLLPEQALAKREFLVMYHGGVMAGRGIETIIRLLFVNGQIRAVILGDGDGNYLSTLKTLAKDLGVDNRVLFHQAVSHNDLWKYVGGADVGMILAPAVCKNHLFSLPNKFFENIQALTPVICPNYPAMKEIVDQYQIGMTCDPTKLDEINECVERMRTDYQLYCTFKENLKRAKEELCWEKEKEKLIRAYSTLV